MSDMKTVPAPYEPAVPEINYSELLRTAMRAQWLSFEAYRSHVLAEESRRPLAQVQS